MNIYNHIIFNITIIFLIKILGYLSFLSKKEWLFVFIGSITTCLLPDIDHPNSFLGRKVKPISRCLYKYFGHRGITHSLLISYILYIFFKKIMYRISNFIIPYNIYYGLSIGYINHILADMFTNRGVNIFWPLKYKINLFYINYINKINILIIYTIIILLLILK